MKLRGLGRCGRLKLTEELYNIRPDLLIFGNSLSGGT